MENKIIYYIIPTDNGWDVMREGVSEEYNNFLGTHNEYEWALELVNAYIEWTGGTLHET